MKNLTNLFLSILIVGLILIGCSDDDNNGSPTQSQNHAPVIQSVTASPSTIFTSWYHGGVVDFHTTTLSCVSTDQDRDSLNYSWACPVGTFLEGIQFGRVVQMYFYRIIGTFTVTVIVDDGIEIDQDSVQVTVIQW